MSEEVPGSTKTTAQPPQRRGASRLLRALIVLVILAAGVAGATYIKKTAPKPKKKAPRSTAALVEAMNAQRSDEQVVVEAMGTVIPAREVVVKARVGGEVVFLHPQLIAGGIFAQGDEMLRIDPIDYRLAVAQMQSRVVDARYQLKLELGHQDVARREWQLFEDGRNTGDLDRELALRQPHLEKAQADLAAAEAQLQQAQLDLARTTIRAPFNAVVHSKSVELGTQASVQEPLATLVGVDEFWVQVSLPVDRLPWIAIPGVSGTEGGQATVFYGSNGFPWQRSGKVLRLLSDLEEEGRMARLLIAVRDPLDRQNAEGKRRPLLLGEFVRVAIAGRHLPQVIALPRSALRDGAQAWVVGSDGRLQIRTVQVVWRDAERVYIESGLDVGEQVVVSDLAAPVAGMALRVAAAHDKELP